MHFKVVLIFKFVIVNPPRLAGHDEKEKEEDSLSQHLCSPSTLLETVAFLWQHTLQPCHIRMSGIAYYCNASISHMYHVNIVMKTNRSNGKACTYLRLD